MNRFDSSDASRASIAPCGWFVNRSVTPLYFGVTQLVASINEIANHFIFFIETLLSYTFLVLTVQLPHTLRNLLRRLSDGGQCSEGG